MTCSCWAVDRAANCAALGQIWPKLQADNRQTCFSPRVYLLDRDFLVGPRYPLVHASRTSKQGRFQTTFFCKGMPLYAPLKVQACFWHVRPVTAGKLPRPSLIPTLQALLKDKIEEAQAIGKEAGAHNPNPHRVRVAAYVAIFSKQPWDPAPNRLCS